MTQEELSEVRKAALETLRKLATGGYEPALKLQAAQTILEYTWKKE